MLLLNSTPNKKNTAVKYSWFFFQQVTIFAQGFISERRWAAVVDLGWEKIEEDILL